MKTTILKTGWALRNKQTGLIEITGLQSDLIEIEKGSEDFELCYISEGEIYNSESDYINS